MFTDILGFILSTTKQQTSTSCSEQHLGSEEALTQTPGHILLQLGHGRRSLVLEEGGCFSQNLADSVYLIQGKITDLGAFLGPVFGAPFRN